MTAKVKVGPIWEEASYNPSETILVVTFLMPSTRLLLLSPGRMNLCSNIVWSLMVLPKSSDRVDQADLSSKINKMLTGESRTRTVVGPFILKLLATETTEIGKTRSRGQMSASSLKNNGDWPHGNRTSYHCFLDIFKVLFEQTTIPIYRQCLGQSNPPGLDWLRFGDQYRRIDW